MLGMSYAVQRAKEGDLETAVEIDDAACELFTEWGVPMVLSNDHPFCVEERGRWRESIRAGSLFFATEAGVPDDFLGFAALGWIDGAPYLEQLSVRPRAMRRGVGRYLLQRAVEWAATVSPREPALWLTTYSHLPFNRPFYESARFAVVREEDCGSEMRCRLDHERRFLPMPHARVAMRSPAWIEN